MKRCAGPLVRRFFAGDPEYLVHKFVETVQNVENLHAVFWRKRALLFREIMLVY